MGSILVTNILQISLKVRFFKFQIRILPKISIQGLDFPDSEIFQEKLNTRCLSAEYCLF